RTSNEASALPEVSAVSGDVNEQLGRISHAFLNHVVRACVSDPLPPSAALPLCKGENVCPPCKGGRPRSGRGALTHARPGVPIRLLSPGWARRSPFAKAPLPGSPSPGHVAR